MYRAYITKGRCDVSDCNGPGTTWLDSRPRVKGVMNEAFAVNGPGTGVPILFTCWRHSGSKYRQLLREEKRAA